MTNLIYASITFLAVSFAIFCLIKMYIEKRVSLLKYYDLLIKSQERIEEKTINYETNVAKNFYAAEKRKGNFGWLEKSTCNYNDVYDVKTNSVTREITDKWGGHFDSYDVTQEYE